MLLLGASSKVGSKYFFRKSWEPEFVGRSKQLEEVVDATPVVLSRLKAACQRHRFICKRLSSFSWLRMHSLNAASSQPTGDTKYPLQKAFMKPVKRPSRRYVKSRLINSMGTAAL
jgi:hypothetical protein